MKKRKHLYNIAKRIKSEDDWKAYRSLKNSINSKINTNYFNRMFDNSFNANHKQFWKHIKAKRKDHHNISTLVADGETIK